MWPCQSRKRMSALVFASFLAVMSISNQSLAHCDTMDGPVVKDAQRALADGNPTPVLKWIPERDEAEIRRAFKLTLSVRGASDEARYLADRYFFETLVRIHRASENEPFTGLKPAGNVNPAIAAADRALADGKVDTLVDTIAAAVRDEISKRFTDAYEKRQVAEDSVEQGREFVGAYVRLTHFAEGIEHIIHEGVDDLVPHGGGPRQEH